MAAIVILPMATLWGNWLRHVDCDSEWIDAERFELRDGRVDGVAQGEVKLVRWDDVMCEMCNRRHV